MSRKTEIKLNITLDEKNIPEQINWDATDAEVPGLKKAEAILLGLWDAQAKSALQIDLWTKEMTVQEMNLFMYQALLTMSDTFYRATGNKVLSERLHQFAQDFIEEIKRQEKNEVKP